MNKKVIRLTESDLHRIVKEAVNKVIGGGQYLLPKVLKYDLDGYRGFGVVDFPLRIEEKFGEFVGHYSNDEADYSLACVWGKTKEEVIEKLYNQLKLYYNYQSNSSESLRIPKNY